MSGAWGDGSWGAGSWGGGVGADITYVDSIPVRENVLRVEFDRPVHYTGLLEASDASRPELWTVTEHANTIGLDGEHARPVRVVQVYLAGAAEGVDVSDEGRFVALVLDRPFTPFPATYTVGWVDVYEEDLTSSTSGTASFQAVYRVLQPPQVQVPRPSKDIANPQTRAAAALSVPNPSRTTLGTFATDSSGDYATDQEDNSLRKRAIRRLTTRKGAFVHLPGYGVGIPSQAKALGTAALLAGLRSDAEDQLSREPDVAQAKVVIVMSSQHPELVRFRVLLRPKVGSALGFEVPFALS